MTYRVRKSFSCAHFYNQPGWSLEKNEQEFGKCFTPYGHGHDYELAVDFASPQPQAVLGQIETLIARLDHQHLNFVFGFFKTHIPTTENLALYIQSQLLENCLRNSLSVKIQQLRLQETPEIWVELSVTESLNPLKLD